MIPPFKEVRLRSIRRWMEDQQPEVFAQLTQSGELESAILEMDSVMDDAFQDADNELMETLMRRNLWSLPEGMQEYHTQRMMEWGKITSRFLPVIFERD